MFKNKNVNLIVVLIATFLITNGTFFVLCEEDAILNYINRVGNWSNAILLKSAYVFAAYTLANSAYNIDYILPKVAHSLFVIKYFDKVNGWLGFSSKGELEAYLEAAKQSYSPLYKDFLTGVNNNVGLPLYNNIWNPFLTFCNLKIFGSNSASAEVITQYVDRTVDRVTHVPVINSQQLTDLQSTMIDCRHIVTDLKFNLTLELSNIRRDWNEFLSRTNVTNHVGEDLSFLANFLSEDYVRSNAYSFARVDFSNINRSALYHITDTAILDAAVTQFNLYTAQLINQQANRGVKGAPLLVAYYSDVISPEGSLIICNISSVFTNEQEFLGIQVSHEQLNTSGGLRLLEFLKNSSNPQKNFLSYNLDSNNLIIKGFLAVTNLDPEGLFNETSMHINALSSPLAQVSVAFTGLASLATGLVDSSQGILHAIDLINNFNSSIQNTEMGAAIASVFMQYGQPLPEILQHYVSGTLVLPNPQEFSNVDFLNGPTPLSNVPDSSVPTPYFSYIGAGIVILGTIGVTWYLTKYGMDASPVVESAKTFKESLQDKYVNFK